MESTRGPWIVRHKDLAITAAYTVEHLPGDDLRSVIAEVREVWMCPEHGGSAEANARLIAKAPELLALLTRLCETNLDTDISEIQDEAQALIAEIEGGG